MKGFNAVIGTLIVVGSCAYAAPGEASPVYQYSINHASVACDGMTPRYEGMLLTRPEGKRNGTLNMAVVQCGGVATPINGYGDVVVYEVGLSNLNSTPITINCSVTDGLAAGTGEPSLIYPKSVTVPANGVAWIDWDGNREDFGN